MITGVRKVVVPVGDQEVARRFWVETLGFETVTDETYGDERWIEVTPPDKAVLLVLSQRGDQPQHDPGDEQLPHSDVFFTCSDINATYAELTGRGVDFPVPPARQHFGWWAIFADPEGTRYALGQW